MLKECGVDSLTLWKIDEVGERLNKINSMIKNWKKEEELCLNMSVYDVKEMYTSLPHKEILGAIEWLTEKFKKKFGEFVTVLGKRAKDIKIGRKNKGDIIGIQEVVETVKMDLENSVFRCGNIMAIQTIGIPMGSPLSPALAITTCAKAESRMMKELEGTIKFQAMRYIDDIWICTFRRTEEEEPKTKEILKFYDRHLKVEIEREGDKVRFLDRMIVWNGMELRSIAFNKNEESMRNEGKRKFQNILPANSYGRKEIKKAIIVGRLFRIQIGTTRLTDCFWQGWLTLMELKMLNYNLNIIRECCGWVDARYKSDLWRFLFKCFLLVGNNYMSCPSNNFKLKG